MVIIKIAYHSTSALIYMILRDTYGIKGSFNVLLTHKDLFFPKRKGVQLLSEYIFIGLALIILS